MRHTSGSEPFEGQSLMPEMFLGVVNGPEHPIGDGAQAGTIRLESVGQPFGV